MLEKILDVRHEEDQALAVVQSLLREAHLLQKGYNVFTDNFYTKPTLAMHLHSEKNEVNRDSKSELKRFSCRSC